MFSTGKESPRKYEGLSPMTFFQRCWVTSYLLMRKEREIVTLRTGLSSPSWYHVPMANVPAGMVIMAIDGAVSGCCVCWSSPHELSSSAVMTNAVIVRCFMIVPFVNK